MVRLLCPPEAAPDFSFNVDFYGLRYAGNLRNLLDWSVFFFGAHAKSELEVMALAADCLRSAGRPVVYVDVGANVGQHLLFMSMHADAAYGFEPWNPVLERARALLTLNHVKNVELFPVALGELREQKRFYPPATRNQGSGSFFEDWFGLNDREASPTFLEVHNGDAFFRAAGINDVSILKVDVEGSEASVIRGLKEAILHGRPFVLLEISGHTAREFGSEENLRACFYRGARFFRLGGGRHRTRLRPYCLDDSLATNTADLAEVLVVPPEHEEMLVSKMQSR